MVPKNWKIIDPDHNKLYKEKKEHKIEQEKKL